MGMIRVSDSVEERLKGVADGRSMNSVIEKMLAYCSSPDGFCYTPQDLGLGERLDNLASYLKEQFTELKTILDETRVDRVSSAGKKSTAKKVYIEWDIIRDLCFEFLRDKPEMWTSTEAKRGAEESDNMQDDPFYTDGEVIYSEGMFGHIDWVKCAPEVMAFLKERGVDVD